MATLIRIVQRTTSDRDEQDHTWLLYNKLLHMHKEMR